MARLRPQMIDDLVLRGLSARTQETCLRGVTGSPPSTDALPIGSPSGRSRPSCPISTARRDSATAPATWPGPDSASSTPGRCGHRRATPPAAIATARNASSSPKRTGSRPGAPTCSPPPPSTSPSPCPPELCRGPWPGPASSTTCSSVWRARRSRPSPEIRSPWAGSSDSRPSSTPWSQTLLPPPQVHCVFPGGALASDGSRWIPTRRPDFLFPGCAFAKVFRGKLLDGL